MVKDVDSFMKDVIDSVKRLLQPAKEMYNTWKYLVSNLNSITIRSGK